MFLINALCAHRRINIEEDRLNAAFTTLDEAGTGINLTHSFIHIPVLLINPLCSTGFLDFDTIKKVLGADATETEVVKVVSSLRKFVFKIFFHG